MSHEQISALLFAGWVALIVAAGLWGLWRLTRHVDREIDRATRLPEHPRALDVTERIDPALIPHDLPRRGSLIDRNL